MQFEKLEVAGAGAMGAEIARVFALSGREVRIVDLNHEALDRARQRIEKTMTKRVTRGFYSEKAAEQPRRGISTSVGPEELGTWELVIESVRLVEEESALRRTSIMPASSVSVIQWDPSS